MSTFLDTEVLVAARNADDEKHGRVKELVRSGLTWEHGFAYTSHYVLDEAVTLMLVRTGRHDLAVDVGDFILRCD